MQNLIFLGVGVVIGVVVANGRFKSIKLQEELDDFKRRR